MSQKRKIKVPRGAAHFRNVYQCTNEEYTTGTHTRTTYSPDEILSIQSKHKIKIPVPAEDIDSNSQITVKDIDDIDTENADETDNNKEQITLPDSELLKVIHYFVSCKITEIMQNINDKRSEINASLLEAIETADDANLHPVLQDILKKRKSDKKFNVEEGFINGLCNYYLSEKLFSFMDETALIALGMLVQEWMNKSVNSLKPKRIADARLVKGFEDQEFDVFRDFGNIIPTTDITDVFTAGLGRIDNYDEESSVHRKKRNKDRKKNLQSKKQRINDVKRKMKVTEIQREHSIEYNEEDSRLIDEVTQIFNKDNDDIGMMDTQEIANNDSQESSLNTGNKTKKRKSKNSSKTSKRKKAENSLKKRKDTMF